MRTSCPLRTPVSIKDVVFEAIFDSGAAVSVMNIELAKSNSGQWTQQQFSSSHSK